VLSSTSSTRPVRVTRDSSPAQSDPRLPNYLVGAVAFATTLVVSVAMETWSKSDGPSQLAVMAVTVGLLSWWSRPWSALFVALCGWLTFDGMVVNGSGHLGWAGREDAVRVAVIFGAGVGAALIREVSLRFGAPHA
jgi:hypothetical protein